MAAEAAAEPDLTEHLLCQVLYCVTAVYSAICIKVDGPSFPLHSPNQLCTHQPTNLPLSTKACFRFLHQISPRPCRTWTDSYYVRYCAVNKLLCDGPLAAALS